MFGNVIEMPYICYINNNELYNLKTLSIMTYLENKLAAIEKAIKSYEGDNGIYARRKVLKLNELAAKVEAKLNK